MEEFLLSYLVLCLSGSLSLSGALGLIGNGLGLELSIEVLSRLHVSVARRRTRAYTHNRE